MRRKFVSFITAIMMLVVCIPFVFVSADNAADMSPAATPSPTPTSLPMSGECGAQGDNVTWVLDSEGTLTVSGTGDMHDYGGGEEDNLSPWLERTDIKRVVVEEGVTSIGVESFIMCENLESVTLPEGLKTISHISFSDCTKLTEINIPDSVEYIAPYAIQNIGYFDNPDNWEGDALYIGKYLIKVKPEADGVFAVKDGTKLIGGTAFFGCENITDIVIPDSVTNICDFAFEGCIGLTSFTVPEQITSISLGMLYGCSGLDEVAIHDKVTSIGSMAFDSCTGLTDIDIPQSVTYIGRHAFSDCTGIAEILLPQAITSIEEGLFYGCEELRSITIPPKVTSIGAWAFGGCDKLESMVIPKSVKSIGEYQFSYYATLKDVYYSGTEQEWNEIEGRDNLPDDITVHYNYGTESTPSPSPTVTPTPTAAAPSPSPTVTPTPTAAAPSPTPSVTPTPTPSPLPKDRVDFSLSDDFVSAKVIFEKVPDVQEEMYLIIACRRGEELVYTSIAEVKNSETKFYIPPELRDCEIRVYVWNKNMKPLMEVQRLEKNIFQS